MMALLTILKETWRTVLIFLIAAFRQTGIDIVKIYRFFIKGDVYSLPVLKMRVTRGKVLSIFFLSLLIIGVIFGGIGDSGNSAAFDPDDIYKRDFNDLRLAAGSSGSLQFTDWQQETGFEEPPLTNQVVDFPSNLSMDLSSFENSQPRREAFLNTIKHLQDLDEVDNLREETVHKRNLTKGVKDGILSDSIEQLMQEYGLKQYLYFHGEQKRLAFAQTYYKWPPVKPDSAFIVQVEKLPAERFMPTVGNGHVATVVNSPTILMNGLYNGKGSISHRARIPSMVAFNVKSIYPSRPSNVSHTMNFGDGIFVESWRSEDYVIDKTTYVHRLMERIVVCELDVLRLRTKNSPQTGMKIKIELNGGSSKDITFSEGKCPLTGCVYIHGKINEAELPKGKILEVHIYYNPLIDVIDVPAPTDENGIRYKYYFYAAISPNPKDAYNAFKEARRTIEGNKLLSTHVSAWRSLWAHSSIVMEGNQNMQLAVTGSLYYIFASMPLRNDTIAPFVGLSPTDLAHGTSLDDYRGHVFWDQEIWIMPTLLLFKPYLAKLILSSRTRTLDAAYEMAKRNHFRGTQFPWESAFTGFETAADVSRNFALFSHHVTGDISFAMMQYCFATRDKGLFGDVRFKKVLNGAATFWDSRLEWDKTKNKYVIRNIMPPDELHYNVSNSAYTNLIAKMAMQAPYRVFGYLGLSNEAFKSVSDKAEEIYQPFDRANLYHPEYEGYKIGTRVKQADVILMPYPLMLELTSVVKRRDLNIYEKVTEKEGPAMTYAMYSIGYASLRDYENAHRMLNKTQMHVRPPFQVWSEDRDGSGAVNFITGAGGFLQGILNGYVGIRIKQHYLEVNPSLPFQVTTLNITGIQYQGGIFHLTIKNLTLSIVQVRTTGPAVAFKIRISATKKDKELLPGHRLTIHREQIAIMQVYGVGETVHDYPREVQPRKPSGKGIVEPPTKPRDEDQSKKVDLWAIKSEFRLPVGQLNLAPNPRANLPSRSAVQSPVQPPPKPAPKPSSIEQKKTVPSNSNPTEPIAQKPLKAAPVNVPKAPEKVVSPASSNNAETKAPEKVVSHASSNNAENSKSAAAGADTFQALSPRMSALSRLGGRL